MSFNAWRPAALLTPSSSREVSENPREYFHQRVLFFALTAFRFERRMFERPRAFDIGFFLLPTPLFQTRLYHCAALLFSLYAFIHFRQAIRRSRRHFSFIYFHYIYSSSVYRLKFSF